MKWLLVILLFFHLILYSQTGPMNPGSSNMNSSLGSLPWNNTSNIFSSDDLKAYVDLNNSGDDSYYLIATNFGFNIPSSDVIDGIVIEIERSDSSGKGNVKDNSIKIVQNGIISGTEKASGGNWSSLNSYKSYGSSTDLWGLTWNYSEINSINFGVAISVKRMGGSGDNRARIDHIRITVYHSNPLPIELLSFSAIQINNKINISWITATELSNDYFIIEKSLDGINFDSLGKIIGAGNSSVQNSYSLDYNDPKEGLNYFRLTQIDYNGQRKTFQIISINFFNFESPIKVITIEGKDFYPGYSGIYIEIYSNGSYRKKITSLE